MADQDKAGFAAFLDRYDDDFCETPYDWLLVSRLRLAIPMPDTCKPSGQP